jgi:hypothetical protein
MAKTVVWPGISAYEKSGSILFLVWLCLVSLMATSIGMSWSKKVNVVGLDVN